ncbi:hypothetical protein VFPFJ_02636 [Purpureocillium lilacinum]|uniref:Uncharacterized protein n=1 Tax=Purpureocillium lilacinum TaxID=33203 RepID=A0A179GLM8_PURLI|nr:hypothetical protein VFPFJ_02636 [Purpureocillium lilacinum]OAQ78785.1 hypothetical protein VFPBJ_06906 [Purpureocillium lilacinum]OAQ93474.1 hypothetical protein VFPFJ_02636 [Purpureocillium lilacinum]
MAALGDRRLVLVLVPRCEAPSLLPEVYWVLGRPLVGSLAHDVCLAGGAKPAFPTGLAGSGRPPACAGRR